MALSFLTQPTLSFQSIYLESELYLSKNLALFSSVNSEATPIASRFKYSMHLLHVLQARNYYPDLSVKINIEKEATVHPFFYALIECSGIENTFVACMLDDLSAISAMTPVSFVEGKFTSKLNLNSYKLFPQISSVARFSRQIQTKPISSVLQYSKLSLSTIQSIITPSSSLSHVEKIFKPEVIRPLPDKLDISLDPEFGMIEIPLIPALQPLPITENVPVKSDTVTMQDLQELVESNPNDVPEKVKSNPELLLEFLRIPLSLHSLDIINRITSGSFSLLEKELLNFLPKYILYAISYCQGIQDKYLQSRLIRLTCVFVQSLFLLPNPLIYPCISSVNIELNAFCIEFSKIKDASVLYRMLKSK